MARNGKNKGFAWALRTEKILRKEGSGRIHAGGAGWGGACPEAAQVPGFL
jgi:hypothetical protein